MNEKIYEFDGTLSELYLLLDISPEFDESGNRIKTINEVLGVRPLFTQDGYEVPRVLMCKHKIKSLLPLDSSRLSPSTLKYVPKKRNQTVTDIWENVDEDLLEYLDKLALSDFARAHMDKPLPKKFARGSQVRLKKINHVNTKFLISKFAKGSKVSLVKKIMAIRRPVNAFVKGGRLDLIFAHGKNDTRNFLAGTLFKIKDKIRTATKLVREKSSSKDDKSKNQNSSKNKSSAKATKATVKPKAKSKAKAKGAKKSKPTKPFKFVDRNAKIKVSDPRLRHNQFVSSLKPIYSTAQEQESKRKSSVNTSENSTKVKMRKSSGSDFYNGLVDEIEI